VLVSGDRRVVLGYVGLDKLVGHWWTDRNNVTIYRRFRLWNLGTDEVIATSPDLPSLVDSAFALSAKGDVVLVYPVARGGALHFYEIRDRRQSRYGGALTNRPDGWCFDASGNLLAKSGTCLPLHPISSMMGKSHGERSHGRSHLCL